MPQGKVKYDTHCGNLEGRTNTVAVPARQKGMWERFSRSQVEPEGTEVRSLYGRPDTHMQAYERDELAKNGQIS